MNSNAQTTDIELWRRSPDDFYSPHIYVTKSGRIGICVGGTCIEKTVEGWHSDGCASCTTTFDIWAAIEVAVRIEGSQKKAAASFGISPQYLSDIRKGKRAIPDIVAKKFGVQSAKIWVPIIQEVQP